MDKRISKLNKKDGSFSYKEKNRVVKIIVTILLIFTIPFIIKECDLHKNEIIQEMMLTTNKLKNTITDGIDYTIDELIDSGLLSSIIELKNDIESITLEQINQTNTAYIIK